MSYLSAVPRLSPCHSAALSLLLFSFQVGFWTPLLLSALVHAPIHVYPLLMTLRPRIYAKYRPWLVALARLLSVVAINMSASVVDMGAASTGKSLRTLAKALILGTPALPGFWLGLLCPTQEAPVLHLVTGVACLVLSDLTRFVTEGLTPGAAVLVQLYCALVAVGGPTALTVYLSRSEATPAEGGAGEAEGGSGRQPYK